MTQMEIFPPKKMLVHHHHSQNPNPRPDYCLFTNDLSSKYTNIVQSCRPTLMVEGKRIGKGKNMAIFGYNFF